jgi:ElaB/YqjD/DUF883 family membrane-anchored ribosome-binding protein
MAQSSYGQTSNTQSEFKDKAAEQLSRAKEQTQDLANRAADQGREASRQMQEVAGNFKGAIDKSIKDQPMATLAVATFVGFVVGALWKS